MNSLSVKKGDNVKIIAGKDKGATGRILAVDTDSKRVIVDNANVVSKHVKSRGPQKPGGIQKSPGTIDASNVQILCPACGKTTRVANTVIDDKKQRTCKKCGKSLDTKQKAEKKEKKAKEEKAEKAAK